MTTATGQPLEIAVRPVLLAALAPSLLCGCSEFELSNRSDAPPGAVPDIEVTPSSLTWGTVASGEQDVRTFTVENVGEAVLHVDDIVIENGLAFSVLTPVPGDLEPGASITVDIAFTPMGTENYGRALVRSDDPADPEVPVDLLGFGAVPELQITPDAHDFGALPIPCEGSVEVELANVGSEVLEITDVDYTAGGMLALGSVQIPMPVTLTPGESRSITISFVASSEDTDTGTLSVTSNDPRGVVTATQTGAGTLGSLVTESFSDPGIPPVDVLLLIDQSCSMAEDNEDDVRDGIPGFVAELQTVSDWQLILVTQDSGCAIGGILDETVPNAEQLIIDNAFIAGPFEQFNTEMLLKLAGIALENTVPGGCNEGFLRPGALLHVIVVSDEKDHSPNPYTFYLGEYQSWLADPALLKVSAVVDVNYACGDNSGPAGYIDAATATGGVVLNICSPTWGTQMTDIASDVLAGIRTYNLAYPTDPSTITVEVNGVPTTDFSYSSANSSVTVNDPPIGEGDVVEITYAPAAGCE